MGFASQEDYFTSNDLFVDEKPKTNAKTNINQLNAKMNLDSDDEDFDDNNQILEYSESYKNM